MEAKPVHYAHTIEVDVRAMLREKLGEEIDEYVILGACNPQLAHRALTIEPALGVFLPCNVVVRRSKGRTIVQALDPEWMAGVPGRSELEPIAREAARRIRAALASVA